MLNTKNNTVIRNFLGKVVNQNDKKEYTVKIVVYDSPLASTEEHGGIHSGAFIEEPNGEIVFRLLYPAKLTEIEVDKQAEYMMDNIETIIADTEYGKNTTNN